MNNDDWETPAEYDDYTLLEMPVEEKTEKATGEKLPELLEGWVKEATNVSHYNDIPAAMTGLVLLGQMVKQFVKIPIKSSLVDSRIHFVWIQTSGTGKSELMNFVIPVSEKLWDKINAFEGYIPHEQIATDEKLQQFDNFDVVEYTDAALIGYQKEIILREADEDQGLELGDIDWEYIKGSLDGHGLARWDEFTNAGVFKQSQHKEGVVTYLNTLMNPIGGSSQIITKKLKEGPKVFCHSERSVLATTFPPENLDKAITETGLFQRAVLYIWEVPEHIKDEIDDMVTDNFGVFEDINLPIEDYTESFFEIYKLTKTRFNEVKDDPTKTIRYSKGFTEALHFRKRDLRRMVSEEEGVIRDTARTFMTRLLIMMGKISVLCCIAESKDIKDPKKRFMVSARNVNQASFIIRNCYKSLISWFIHSLKVRKSDLVKKGKGSVFLKIYNELKNDDGWVHKTKLMDGFKKETKLGQVQAYHHFNLIQNHFITEKQNKSAFLKLKGDEK
tara:strand:- start:1123 stop:2628 length:1506 start_codon:yes stop_codon:yes gene_type:complete